MEYAIFDLDHTLADSFGRDQLLKASRYDCKGLQSSMDSRDWDIYHSRLMEDQPRREVVRIYNGLRATKIKTIIMTARPVKYERMTIDWLRHNNIEYNKLMMRPRDNTYPSPSLKIDMASKILGVNWFRRVALVVDDHPGVIDAFGKFGVTGLLCKQGNL